MANTAFRGPLISLGALIGNVLTSAGLPVAAVEPYDGPDISYQGNGVPDPRYYPANKDAQKCGALPAFLNGTTTVLTDAIPETRAANNIAATQHAVAATAMALVTTCPGGGVVSTYYSHGCPAVVPMNQMGAATGASFPNQGAAVNALALDFGFSVGDITAGSATIANIPDTTLFFPGQWICIGGAANVGKTLGLVTQVLTVGASSITVGTVPQGTLTAAPIGSANSYGPFPGGPNAAATSANPYIAGGFAAVFNPMEAISRGVVIVASNSAAVGGTFLVSGADIYGQAMSEAVVSAPATDSSQTVYGKKAFKYIFSVVPANSDSTFNYTVGTSDVFGIHFRTVEWEGLDVNWAAASMTATQGWLQADRTSPALSTTGDVRGTIQASAFGGGTGIGTNTSNNARRLFIAATPSSWQMTAANPNNPVPLFGVKQA